MASCTLVSGSWLPACHAACVLNRAAFLSLRFNVVYGLRGIKPYPHSHVFYGMVPARDLCEHLDPSCIPPPGKPRLNGARFANRTRVYHHSPISPPAPAGQTQARQAEPSQPP